MIAKPVEKKTLRRSVKWTRLRNSPALRTCFKTCTTAGEAKEKKKDQDLVIKESLGSKNHSVVKRKSGEKLTGTHRGVLRHDSRKKKGDLRGAV